MAAAPTVKSNAPNELVVRGQEGSRDFLDDVAGNVREASRGS